MVKLLVSFNKIFENLYLIFSSLENGDLSREKQQIVSKHNELRSLVLLGILPGYPRAKNITMLASTKKTFDFF